MAECAECGEYVNLPYQCRRCGKSFCGEHRLPENHDCPGLEDWNDPGGVFDSGFDESVQSSGAGGRTAGVTGSLRSVWRSYFRGNVAYVVLALMWVTFLLQFAVAPALLTQSQWYAAFTLSSEHPLYVWTWVTSVFAHGGFYHIAANSIALYFFGPVVERRLGSRRFLALFLVAGMLAGLAQVGVAIATGAGVARVLGASGGLMAIMGVLTVLNPGLRVYLYFVIPMPLWVLTFGFAAFSIFAGFGTVGGGGVAHWAHLAGLGIGLAYGWHVKGELKPPEQLQFGGGGRGPGGPGGRL